MRLARVVVFVAAVVLAGCDGASEPDAVGVRPAVSDAEVLADVEPRIEENPDDPVVGTWFLLGRKDQPEVPLVLVEVRPVVPELVVDDDVQLSDGSFADVEVPDDPGSLTVVSFVSGGQWVGLKASEVAVASLVSLASSVDVDAQDLALGASEWSLLGSIPFPNYAGGYTTIYDLGEDGSVSIEVHRLAGDEMLLARFGPTFETSLDGVDVLRYEVSETGFDGVVFERDGLLVTVRATTRPGLLSSDDVADIASSLRLVDGVVS